MRGGKAQGMAARRAAAPGGGGPPAISSKMISDSPPDNLRGHRSYHPALHNALL